MHTSNLCYSKYDYEVTNKEGVVVSLVVTAGHHHHYSDCTITINAYLNLPCILLLPRLYLYALSMVGLGSSSRKLSLV
jgi:hypothetical protein